MLKVGDSRDEVELCAAICDYTAEHGPEELADEQRDPNNAGRGIVTYSPIGVIYGIQPWNFPAYQVIRYAIANLMTGNGVLLKHAANCTGSGLKIEEIFQKGGLPENLFTVLVIDHDLSDEVIAYDKVRGVTLTNSRIQLPLTIEAMARLRRGGRFRGASFTRFAAASASGEAALQAAKALRHNVLDVAAILLQTEAHTLDIRSGLVVDRATAEERMPLEEVARATSNLASLVRIFADDQLDSKVLLGSYTCTDVPGEFKWEPGA